MRIWGGIPLWIMVAVWLLSSCRSVAGAEPRDNECLSCHAGIETISDHHRFPCVDCHGGNPASLTTEEAHRGLVLNPSALDHAPSKCGACHHDEVACVSRSLMATAAGLINQTRAAFGNQDLGEVRYAVTPVDVLKRLPEPTEETLVDDLLRRRCLRCHLRIPGVSRRGDHHAEGCAACHVLYADDGLPRTGDQAIRDAVKARAGQSRAYPVAHRFTTRIPTKQCAHCHNGNRVGADYMGMFERDHHQAYRFLSPDGESFVPLYGLDHHRLLPDVHFERGLHCIDCHVQSELMGDGRLHGFSHQALKVTCRDCHGTPATAPTAVEVVSSDRRVLAPARLNPLVNLEPGDRVIQTSSGERLPNVRRLAGDVVLTSKVTGKNHRVPVLHGLTEQPVDHRIPEHISNMTCHSCHAAWSFQDYGLHLFREDVPRYEKWRPLWAQNDPQVQKLLAENLVLEPEQRVVPRSRDYLSGEIRTGVWFSGWSLRRWAGNVLGRGMDGMVRVFRPYYQYVVTWVDRLGVVRWDGRIPETRGGRPGLIMNPYAPHTIRKQVVRCEGCHLNPKAAGLGNLEFVERDGRMIAVPLESAAENGLDVDFPLCRMVDLDGEPLQASTLPGARPFNRSEIRSLLVASKTYQRTRLEDLADR